MSSDITPAMQDVIDRCNGLYVGMLDEAERDALSALCDRGMARVVYPAPAIFTGLGKVEIAAARTPETEG